MACFNLIRLEAQENQAEPRNLQMQVITLPQLLKCLGVLHTVPLKNSASTTKHQILSRFPSDVNPRWHQTAGHLKLLVASR